MSKLWLSLLFVAAGLLPACRTAPTDGQLVVSAPQTGTYIPRFARESETRARARQTAATRKKQKAKTRPSPTPKPSREVDEDIVLRGGFR